MAEELFNELGYKKKTFRNVIKYYKSIKEDDNEYWWEVEFRLNWETYEFSFYYSENTYSGVVDTKLHKAITQQMKELGWL